MSLTRHDVYESVPRLVHLQLPDASRLFLVQPGAVLLQELELVVDVALPQPPVVLAVEFENGDGVVAETAAAAAVPRGNLVGQPVKWKTSFPHLDLISSTSARLQT